MEAIRLSDTSAQVTAALARLDASALNQLTERLNSILEAISTGRMGVESEPAEAVERELHILEGVLRSTEDNIHVLERLQQRRAGQAWAV